jgi:uncharacterized protein YcnI
MDHLLRLGFLVATVLAVSAMAPARASAHADADVIAVAAGEQVTINFRPDHGCGESPTTEVAVRVPVAGATPGKVDGWTETSSADGDERTVLEWTGGSLPTDQTGTFPVTFTAPDKVGELLLFPAVQECADGEELSWISGDPESDNPAPRLLILAPGSEEAVTVDDVPQEAPGRELLTAVIDTEVTTTTSPASTTTSSETTVSAAPTSTTDPSRDESGPSGSDDASPLLPIGIGLVVVALIAGGAILWQRRSPGSNVP